MPKQANSFIQISKRLASLQPKLQKINDEINALVEIVAVEMRKQADTTPPAPTPATKQVPAKKAVVKAPSEAPKKRGRPSKK